MAKEELERGVDGGEVTRTWFPPESKRQGNSNSFAFIHRLIRQTEKVAHYSRLSGYTAMQKLTGTTICHSVAKYSLLLGAIVQGQNSSKESNGKII